MVLLGNMVQPVKMIIQLKWSFYLGRPCIPVGPFFKIRPFVTVESFYVYTPQLQQQLLLNCVSFDEIMMNNFLFPNIHASNHYRFLFSV